MMLCSVSICLLAAPDIFFCVMWKKTKRSREEEEEVKDLAGQEPVYDKLQEAGRSSSSNMELKTKPFMKSQSDVC